ncbi:DUF3224 domain-containing protein [Saccharopolyspora phatthalungensis]|uniref:DUF3224 domain-containing protein n=1 Tax=Saccharopolyspora phatthalungensis TaxID=664693 RepID=A0A840Q7P9_9PSEU|nr:DUF3224 domain-containing protein [Saccharopolyspora phatthalungensis]MBB5154425.1 hypothetical protein [Saccharopolyspora phatthalungensis]
MTKQTTGSFAVSRWEESAVGNPELHPKLAHAAVTNDFSGGIEAAGASCEYTIAYVTEATGRFTGMQLLSGTLAGRKGTFIFQERGWFGDDGVIHSDFEVLPGSGTDELAGLRGTGHYTAEPGKQVAYTFDYDLD